MPLSMQVTLTPSNSSTMCPVGSRLLQTEPAVSRKLMRIGAAVPGQPSMRASPSYEIWPPGVCTVMSASVPVLRVSTRAVVAGARAATSPRSIANGTTAASMLPQFGVVSTRGSLISTCANRNSRSTPGRVDRATIAALLVSGSAPPRPSICLRSGEPMTARSTRSRSAGSAGRARSRRKGARGEPPPTANEGRRGRIRCADCHGLDARGYRGPDLTALLSGETTDERLFQTIRKGVPGTDMPPQRELDAPDDDLLMIIAYLRKLGTVAPVERPTGNVE